MKKIYAIYDEVKEEVVETTVANNDKEAVRNTIQCGMFRFYRWEDIEFYKVAEMNGKNCKGLEADKLNKEAILKELKIEMEKTAEEKKPEEMKAKLEETAKKGGN